MNNTEVVKELIKGNPLLTESQKANRVIRINIQNDILGAIEAPLKREALDEAIDNVQDRIRYERSKASQLANIDVVATCVANDWIDTDWQLEGILDYLSVSPEEFVEYLRKEGGQGWFDDDEKISEIEANLVN